MSLFSASTVSATSHLSDAFRRAQPFRHVVIDDFLDASVARALLAEFPRFEEKYALNEMGQVGGKAVRMQVRDIGASYRGIDDAIRSAEFLNWVSAVTGIPDLLYDPDYIGGGTHENVHGQGLDAHVDFNYHPGTKWHRRLNLIVYLNDEWHESWGGALELQSDPWNPAQNTIKRVLPLFNRCVIFETNEISWHGFPRIELPSEQRAISRKSFAIYLYTKERPPAETAASHATVYVPDTRPSHIGVGTMLNAEQVAELDARYAHLRGQLKFLYDREQDFARQIESLNYALDEARRALRVDLQGYATQSEGVGGLWPDGWCAREFTFSFVPTRAVRGIGLDVWIHHHLDRVQDLRIEAAGLSDAMELRPGARRVLELPIRAKAGETVTVRVQAACAYNPKTSGASEDARDLAFKLLGAVLTH
jgi:hypothetical protein